MCAGWACAVSSSTLSWFYSTYWATSIWEPWRVVSRPPPAGSLLGPGCHTRHQQSHLGQTETGRKRVPAELGQLCAFLLPLVPPLPRWPLAMAPGPEPKGVVIFQPNKAGPGAALVHGSAVPWPVHLLVVPVHPHFVGVILQEALQADPFRGAEDLQRRSGGPCTERDALRPAGSSPAGGLVGRGVVPPGPLRPRLGAQARGPRPPGPSASSRLWPLTPCHTRPSHKHVPHQNDLEDAYAGYRERRIIF